MKNYILLVVLGFLFFCTGCEKENFMEDELIQNEEVMLRHDGVLDDVAPDPSARGYKLIMKSGDWAFTGQYLGESEVWDCFNVLTHSWVFETRDECYCKVQEWDKDNQEDAICIFMESCTYGNFIVNDECIVFGP